MDPYDLMAELMELLVMTKLDEHSHYTEGRLVAVVRQIFGESALPDGAWFAINRGLAYGRTELA